MKFLSFNTYHLKIASWYIWDIPKIYLRLPKIYLRFIQNIPEICLRLFCLKYSCALPEIYPKFTWDIPQINMAQIYFFIFEKTPNFGRAVRTHFRVRHPFFCSKKDRLCLIRRCVKFQQPNPFLKFNLSHLKKIIFNHSEGGWEGQNKSLSYRALILFATF